MELRLTDTRFILSVIIFSILYVVSDLTLIAGITEPTFAIQLIITICIGVAFAIIMGVIFTQIPVSRRARFLLAWPALFVIQWFNPMLEGFFFTTMLTEFTLLAGLIFGVLISSFHAVLVAILFPLSQPSSLLQTELQGYFNQKSWRSWLWRVALSSTSFLLIYYTIGHIISPLVIPFYLSLEYGLRVPSVGIIIGLEFFRGFLYIIILLPILATLKTDPKRKWILIAVLLYVPGIAFLLPDPTLPALLRVIHGTELLIDSLIIGAIITYLLGTKNSSLELHTKDDL